MIEPNDLNRLVERLRDHCEFAERQPMNPVINVLPALHEAAATITRLREALEKYADDFCEDAFRDLCGHHTDCAGCRARQALGGEHG